MTDKEKKEFKEQILEDFRDLEKEANDLLGSIQILGAMKRTLMRCLYKRETDLMFELWKLLDNEMDKIRDERLKKR